MISQQQPYSFIDYPLFTKSLNELPSKSTLLVNTINQYSYCMANVDSAFKESLKKSDVLLPDGIAVVAAARWLTGRKIHKIAGADLHQHVLAKLNKKGGSCFYLGSAEATLQKIKDRLAIEYPNVKVETYSPPYKAQFSREDNEQMINAINAFKPDILFVGMTAPKQEKWACDHKHEIKTKMICTIGAVFDFYAGTIERPSEFMINMGLEWLGRLVKEPKRLWKRYLYFGPLFLRLIVKEKIKQLIAGQSYNNVVMP